MLTQLDVMSRALQNAAKLKFTNAPCSRCCGSGWIEQFGHVAMGVCFRCWTIGKEPVQTLQSVLRNGPVNNYVPNNKANKNDESLFATCPTR